MISNITSKYQTNYKPLTKVAPTFAGDKDILIINDREIKLTHDKNALKEALGEKLEEYTIHTAIGGKEGLEKAKQYTPFLTVTAYNMRDYLPYGSELICTLKRFSKNIIVRTSNWNKHGNKSKKAGIKKCEKELGATKYVHDGDYAMFVNSIKAIINGTSLPKYPFQKSLISNLLTFFEY